MRDVSSLAALLPALITQPFEGVLYRAVRFGALLGNPPYLQMRPLYNLGASANGARYTPKGSMPSLYLAEDIETATAEVNQVYAKLIRQTPVIQTPIPPCVQFSVRVRFNSVLNLRDPAIQRALQTSDAELIAAWREAQESGSLPPTQQLGQAAFDCNCIQALRYPSAQLSGHACYVVFTDRLAGSAFVEVYDPDGNLKERLPEEP